MPSPSASDLRAFIPARNFALSQRFYNALGWPTHEVGPGIALVRIADEQHFYIQDYYIKEVAENTMLHITVIDAQAWYTHVAAILVTGRFTPARVQLPARQAYGARVTFVHDPSGVLLHLCQWET